jgi:hypothetical protein
MAFRSPEQLASSPRAESRFSAAEAALILSLVALLCWLRSPAVFADPRFWAEEADLFLPHSMLTGCFEGLFGSPTSRSSALGVLAVLPFVAGVRTLPLEWIPALTTGLAAAVYLAPMAHLLVAPSYLAPTRVARVLAVGVLLFAPYGAASGEVWMNAMNTATHVGVYGLVLATERFAEAGVLRRAYARVVLALGAVNGVYLAVLAPVFAWKAWRERSREAWVQCGIVATGLLVQGAFFVYLKSTEQILDQRLVSFEWARSVAGILEYQVLLPVFGVDLGVALLSSAGVPLGAERGFDWAGPAGTAIGMASLAIIGTLLLSFSRPFRDDLRTVLAAAFGAWALVTGFFSVNAVPWGRYSVAPSIALGLLLLAATRDRARPVRTVAAALLAVMLATGAYEFQFATPATFTGKDGYAVSWRDEVRRWRDDPDRAIQSWPRGQWHAYVPEPGFVVALHARAAALDADRPAGLSRLEIDVPGLPAVFGLALELAAESGNASRYAVELVGDSGQVLYREETEGGPRGTVVVNSIDIRARGFGAFSRVRRILVVPVSVPPALPRFRVEAARTFSPIMTWAHPRSGK